MRQPAQANRKDGSFPHRGGFAPREGDFVARQQHAVLQRNIGGLRRFDRIEKLVLIVADPYGRSFRGAPGFAAAEVFEGAGANSSAIKMVGNPVRSSVLAGNAARGRASLGIPAGAVMLLVFGGSLGAQHLNEELAALKSRLLAQDNLYIVHSTGADGYEACASALALTEEEKKRYRLMPYIEDMGDMLAAADLVLSRAGASSIAEIAALAVPSVLVPYPFATADHQTTNARYLVDTGAAVMFKDDAIGDEAFATTLANLLKDGSARARMAAAARGLAQDKAAERLADELLALVK